MEETKLFLFVDTIILYVEKTKDFARILLEFTWVQ